MTSSEAQGLLRDAGFEPTGLVMGGESVSVIVTEGGWRRGEEYVFLKTYYIDSANITKDGQPVLIIGRLLE